MTPAKQYWLMKCEPEAYTIDALAKDGTTSWEGVRNFQARNFLRQMRVGDLVQFQPGHEYHDPTSRKEKPKWYTVDVRYGEKFSHVVSLETMKRTPGLGKMMVVQPGRRPSVQPVTQEQFDMVRKLARGGA